MIRALEYLVASLAKNRNCQLVAPLVAMSPRGAMASHLLHAIQRKP
jgi:hypothetical protein